MRKGHEKQSGDQGSALGFPVYFPNLIRPMAWPEHLIHFIDFEGSPVSGILEYGVVSLRAGEVVATQGRACRATGRIRPEDSAIHGLDEDALAGCAAFTEEFEYFAGLRGSGPLAAHFANAENSLIKKVWPYARSAPDFSREGSGGFFGEATTAEWGPWIDTGRLFPQARGVDHAVKLADLIAAEGLQRRLDKLAVDVCPPDRRRYHAALYDALAGALLLDRLAAIEGWGDKSLRWLLEHSTLNPVRRETLRQDELFGFG